MNRYIDKGRMIEDRLVVYAYIDTDTETERLGEDTCMQVHK